MPKKMCKWRVSIGFSSVIVEATKASSAVRKARKRYVDDPRQWDYESIEVEAINDERCGA